ncbi:MAG TPA: STAS/SEC14 domain-containing protein [Bacteroidota bacterium]|nr:STAS/SEC14 domain-containing protein [Bacteroidota bacterium]
MIEGQKDGMKPPDHVEVFEGEIATYWMDENGILNSLSKDPKRTVQNISENISLVKRITGNKQVPLLIYLCNSPVPDKATQKFSTEHLSDIYSAMAMVSRPGLAKLIMNLLFAFKPPPIPMKSFSNDREAREWLKQFCSR